MPQSNVTHGHGAELLIKIGAGALTKVAEIDDIPELPSFETELYETSSFDTQDVKEFKKLPLRDGVPITIRGNYVLGSSSETLLQQAADEEGACDYQIKLRQGADLYLIDGAALFYNLKRMNPKDAKRTFEITMKPVDLATPVLD